MFHAFSRLACETESGDMFVEGVPKVVPPFQGATPREQIAFVSSHSENFWRCGCSVARAEDKETQALLMACRKSPGKSVQDQIMSLQLGRVGTFGVRIFQGLPEAFKGQISDFSSFADSCGARPCDRCCRQILTLKAQAANLRM